MGITSRIVFNIEVNYKKGGLEKALYDDPRPGTPICFDDRIKSQIVALVCSNPPQGFDRWTLDLIQEHSVKKGIVSSIGRDTIQVILQEHDLKPWQQKSWCIPDFDDEFIEKMEDVLKVYEKPYDKKKPVVCLDEKPIQLLDDIRSPYGIESGKMKKMNYEYKRNGTANVFCAVEPKRGVYLNKVTHHRTSDEFAKFLASLERRYSHAEKIILVMDNLNAHNKKALLGFYGQEKGKRIWSRFKVHYTPKHTSWLNQAEIAINMYARQCLGKTRIPDLSTLRKRTSAWNKIVNRRNVTINWKFTIKEARKKFSYM